MAAKSASTNTSTTSEAKNAIDLKEEAKQLVKKIQDHYLAIEEHRKKGREVWRILNGRIENLEEVKSQRGKRRKHADMPVPEARTQNTFDAA